MKDFINKYKNYLIIGVVAIIMIGIGFMVSNPKTNEYLANNTKVEQDVVDELYNSLEVNDCTIVDLNSKDKDKEAILYVIFTKLNKEEKLNDEISMTDYQEIAKELLGTETDVYPENYQYGTYIYTKGADKITREQVKCDSNTKYVSKLYGYSYGIDNLTVHIKVGYIKNNKVYDLNDKILGEYTEDKLNGLLDNATLQEYNYKKDNDKYYLDNVK